MTESNLNHTKSLRRILRLFWPDSISNQDLLDRCQLQEDMATIFIRRRCNWLGHVLRRDSDSNIKTTLFWTPGRENGREEGPKSIGSEQWMRNKRTKMKLGHTPKASK